MATMKFNRKPAVDGIENISIIDDPKDTNNMIIKYMGANKFQQGQLVVPKGHVLRVECNGGVTQLKSENCATVIGDVRQAQVGNVLEVEGYVVNFQCPRQSISVEKSIKVVRGAESRVRDSVLGTGYNRGKQTVKVLHIDGQLRNLQVHVSGIEVRLDVIGNVHSANVGNLMQVKGKVLNCQVGNIISATMGMKSTGKSTRTLKAERDKFNEETDRIVNEMLQGFRFGPQ